MDKIYCLEKIVPYSCTKNKILRVESFLLFGGKVVKIAVPTKQIVILISVPAETRPSTHVFLLSAILDVTHRIEKAAVFFGNPSIALYCCQTRRNPRLRERRGFLKGGEEHMKKWL